MAALLASSSASASAVRSSRAVVVGVAQRTFASASYVDKHGLPNVVLVDGVRTPFQTAGTGFKESQPYDLGKIAIHNLIKRNVLDPAKIDRLIYGSVIQEVKTSNIAREAALGAGVPRSVPASTVTMACISSNLAITNGVDAIRSGQADIIVAGGVEVMSDVPIRFSRPVRARMIASQKLKSPMQYLGLLGGLKMKDLAPEVPAVAEFSSNETMGFSADRLAANFGVSRVDSDKYAMRSHHNAAKAAEKNLFKDLVPVRVPRAVEADNGIRGDTTMEKLSSLKPAFVKPHGTVTAGNASFLTDGASAALIMSEKRALELGYKPLAYLREYLYVAQDPKDELLLGPAYGIGRILDKTKTKLSDYGVFEIHEAFAGQVLANLNALNSDKFAKEKQNLSQKVGLIPMEKINNWGGSLSIGHPFGATGVRLVTTAAHRLHHENQQFAMVAACAAGGLGHVAIIERYPQK